VKVSRRFREEKIKDVQKFRSPTNGVELKSFLGLTNYLRDYIPNFSDLTRPIRAVDGKNKFRWGKEQERSFQAVKQAIVECTTKQGYYSLKDKTVLYTDASPFGLGAVLVQVNSEGAERVISFASKSLTPTEQNYPHPQREALGVVWGVEHFFYYLLGNRFTIRTDADGIRYIFDKNKHKDKPTRMLKRAEGWALRLDMFDYEIEYVKGKKNIADPSSRLYETEEEPEPYQESTALNEVGRIQIITIRDIHFDDDHMPIMEVAMATEQCPELKRVMRALETGNWDNDLTGYQTNRDVLGMTDGVLVQSGLVVVPISLRKKALRIAHKGHQCAEKTKSLLRERVWWPKMTKSVEEWVTTCYTCVLNGRKHKPVPMQRTPMPEEAWEYLAIDYCGPYAS
jgi:RNase H-like domain found in reverse transcriptase/Integrase zinc binding domain